MNHVDQPPSDNFTDKSLKLILKEGRSLERLNFGVRLEGIEIGRDVFMKPPANLE